MFRKFGGLTYAAHNNIVKNNLQSSDNFSITNILGQVNSKIVSQSHIDMSGNSILNLDTIYFMDGTTLSTAGGGTSNNYASLTNTQTFTGINTFSTRPLCYDTSTISNNNVLATYQDVVNAVQDAELGKLDSVTINGSVLLSAPLNSPPNLYIGNTTSGLLNQNGNVYCSSGYFGNGISVSGTFGTFNNGISLNGVSLFSSSTASNSLNIGTSGTDNSGNLICNNITSGNGISGYIWSNNTSGIYLGGSSASTFTGRLSTAANTTYIDYFSEFNLRVMSGVGDSGISLTSLILDNNGNLTLTSKNTSTNSCNLSVTSLSTLCIGSSATVGNVTGNLSCNDIYANGTGGLYLGGNTSTYDGRISTDGSMYIDYFTSLNFRVMSTVGGSGIATSLVLDSTHLELKYTSTGTGTGTGGDFICNGITCNTISIVGNTTFASLELSSGGNIAYISPSSTNTLCIGSSGTIGDTSGNISCNNITSSNNIVANNTTISNICAFNTSGNYCNLSVASPSTLCIGTSGTVGDTGGNLFCNNINSINTTITTATITTATITTATITTATITDATINNICAFNTSGNYCNLSVSSPSTLCIGTTGTVGDITGNLNCNDINCNTITVSGSTTLSLTSLELSSGGNIIYISPTLLNTLCIGTTNTVGDTSGNLNCNNITSGSSGYIWLNNANGIYLGGSSVTTFTGRISTSLDNMFVDYYNSINFRVMSGPGDTPPLTTPLYIDYNGNFILSSTGGASCNLSVTTPSTLCIGTSNLVGNTGGNINCNNLTCTSILLNTILLPRIVRMYATIQSFASFSAIGFTMDSSNTISSGGVNTYTLDGSGNVTSVSFNTLTPITYLLGNSFLSAEWNNLSVTSFQIQQINLTTQYQGIIIYTPMAWVYPNTISNPNGIFIAQTTGIGPINNPYYLVLTVYF
jgi:hypothetical protein